MLDLKYALPCFQALGPTSVWSERCLLGTAGGHAVQVDLVGRGQCGRAGWGPVRARGRPGPVSRVTVSP